MSNHENLDIDLGEQDDKEENVVTTEEEENKESEQINVYGQEIWHDEVLILSTRDSLYKLKNAIDEALDTGKGKVERRTSDKDAYDIHVLVKEDEDPEWDEVELPYRGEMAQNERKTISKEDLIR